MTRHCSVLVLVDIQDQFIDQVHDAKYYEVVKGLLKHYSNYQVVVLEYMDCGEMPPDLIPHLPKGTLYASKNKWDGSEEVLKVLEEKGIFPTDVTLIGGFLMQCLRATAEGFGELQYETFVDMDGAFYQSRPFDDFDEAQFLVEQFNRYGVTLMWGEITKQRMGVPFTSLDVGVPDLEEVCEDG